MGPTNVEEQQSFTHLTSAIREGKFSCCIGWVIKQRKHFLSDMSDPEGDLQGICSTGYFYSPPEARMVCGDVLHQKGYTPQY